MKLQFIWKQKTSKYQTGETLYLNGYEIAAYSYNSTQQKGSTKNNWVGVIFLPSLLSNSYTSNDEEQLKKNIEIHVENWFKTALKGADYDNRKFD